MIQFFVILPTVCRVDCIGCESKYTGVIMDWIGLGRDTSLDLVGLDLEKWTLVHNSVSTAVFVGSVYRHP